MGETVGVVKSERGLSGEHRHILRKVRHDFVKFFQALFDGLCKLVFFRFEFAYDSALVLFDIGICLFILCNIEFCKRYECAVVDVESSAISHSSADKAAQNVTLIDV